MNGVFGRVGAPAAVVVMELRSERGPGCERKNLVAKTVKGHPKKQSHVWGTHALVRNFDFLTDWNRTKFNIVKKSFFLMYQVHCEWSEWFSWSPCSFSCGLGNQTRTRNKKRALFGGKDCEGGSVEARNCTIKTCPGMA